MDRPVDGPPYVYTQPQVEDNRSLGELFSDLWQGAQVLVSQEVELAKTEMSQKASQVGKDAAYIAVGGFVIYAGFLAILAGIIAGLAALIPLWLSALIVGVVVAVIGYAVVQKGISNLKHQSLAPQQTVDSLKESKEWAQDQMR